LYVDLRTIDPNPPTTLCPNGETIDLSLSKEYLGDEYGRWTDSPFSTELAGIDRCGSELDVAP
jgi:hypothetical protein